MKKNLFTLLLFSMLIAKLSAGVPQGLNYQAVARNASGNVLPNQSIHVRLTIHDTTTTGTVVYQETDLVTTNQFGLFDVVIGNGVVVAGNFTTVNWGSAAKFLQVEMDATGGNTFVDMGTTQLQSVPYAQYAGNVPHTGFRVTGAVDTSVAQNATVYRIYPTVDFNDGGGAYDVDSGIYTVPSPGLYHFAANEDINFTAGTFTGYISIVIYLNGSFLSESDFLPGNNDYVSLQTWADVKLVAGDRVQVGVINGTNTTVTEYISDSYNNFTGYKIY